MLQWQLPSGVSAAQTLWPLPQKIHLGDLVNYGFEDEVTLVSPVTFEAGFVPPADGLLRIGLTAHWLVCRTECIPQSTELQLQLPLTTQQNQISSGIADTLARQPQSFPGKVSARIDNQHLVLQASDWPSGSVGQRIHIFPEQNEVIASPAEQHPLARTEWQNGVFQARLPLSELRSTAPHHLTWWWLTGTADTARAWQVDTPVQGAWPELPKPRSDSNPIQSTGAAPNPIVAPSPGGGDLGLWGALLGALLGGFLLNLMPCVLPVLAIKMVALSQGSVSTAMRRLQGWAYTGGVLLFLLGLGAGLLALRAAGQAAGWGFQLQSPGLVALLALLFIFITLNLSGLFEIHSRVPSAILQWQARHPALDAFLTGLLSVVVATPCSAPFMGASLGLAVTLPWVEAMGVFAMLGLGLASPYLVACHWPSVVAFMPKPGPWMNRFRRMLAIPMAATAFWLLWVLVQQTIEPPTDHNRPNLARADSPADAWLAWSPQVVEQAQAQGRTVFVDFTAAWCITCQVNKRTTLERPVLRQLFLDKNVLTLRADWTRHDPAITQALTELGRSGIPVYAIYRPGAAPIVLSELISVQEVQDALR